MFFFFNDTATTDIYPLSLHDALPIYYLGQRYKSRAMRIGVDDAGLEYLEIDGKPSERTDRKSTRLNSSHVVISYAVFCLKKKKETLTPIFMCKSFLGSAVFHDDCCLAVAATRTD